MEALCCRLVVGAEYLRNLNFLGTFKTVTAAGAWNQNVALKCFCSFANSLKMPFIETVTVIKLHIFSHLFRGGHAGKGAHNPIKAVCKAQGKVRIGKASVRTCLVEYSAASFAERI